MDVIEDEYTFRVCLRVPGLAQSVSLERKDPSNKRKVCVTVRCADLTINHFTLKPSCRSRSGVEVRRGAGIPIVNPQSYRPGEPLVIFHEFYIPSSVSADAEPDSGITEDGQVAWVSFEKLAQHGPVHARMRF